MDLKRTKGRPKRQDGDPGRDKLISAARDLLRGGAGIDLVGKELAVAAGVTPALVRYYFQDRSSLIEAVARPIIDDYVLQLKTLLRQPTAVDQRLRALIIFLLTIGSENGYLLESYIFYVKKTSRVSANFLVESFSEMSRFLQECQSEGFIRKTDLAITSTVIWGICKTIMQIPELKPNLATERASAAEFLERQADIVMDILVAGLKLRADP